MPTSALDPAASPGTAPIYVVLSAPANGRASIEHLLGRLPVLPDVALIALMTRRDDVEALRSSTAPSTPGRVFTETRDGERIEAGRVYLLDHDMLVEVAGGRFRLQPMPSHGGRSGIVDSLLVSLARDQPGRVLAVALAGTDGDGTLGFKTIKETDNLAIAEETDEVRTGELTASEGPAALADAIVPLDGLAERIIACVRHLATHPSGPLDKDEGALKQATALAAILSLLHDHTGHDFRGYKDGTFLRRVQRRMHVVEADDLEAYGAILRKTPDEVQKLFNDLLIGVTRFFRDEKEFERMEQTIVPALFQGKGPGDQVRLWVIGCSTGEEAYSLAILLREFMAGRSDLPGVQIFATDLDGRALAAARAGRYPESVVGDLTPERLARWFVQEGATYSVARELREMCVFAEHSVLKDAPFSRLDLVSCRNLLIYLDQDLQERVLPLLHFALRDGGFLFLGNSENAARHSHLFAPLALNSRIFRRVETPARPVPELAFSTNLPVVRATAPDADDARPDLLVARRVQRFAERYTPAFIVLDEDLTVLHFHGRVGRFIDPARGTASLHLMQLVHPDLRLDLRMALTRVRDHGGTVCLDRLRVGSNGHQALVDVIVEASQEGVGTPRAFFVLFKDRPDPGPGDEAATAVEPDRVRDLEQELGSTQQRLQAAREQMESASEEQAASDEEYQTLYEELQSMNEELQTSKEELQSVNEELTTLNGELGQRVRDLSRTNIDLQNLLASTQIASLFLDHDLRIANFTPAAGELFHLVASDVGRPIAHIKARIAYDTLQDDARRVLRTLNTQEREIDNPNTGVVYLVRVLPYRNGENYIAGIVATFIDVTELRRRADQIREREARFSALKAATSSTTYRMSADWTEMHQLEGVGFLADTPQPKPSVAWLREYIPEGEQSRVNRAIAEAIREKRTFELRHKVYRADGSIGWTLSRAVPVLDEAGEIREWIGVASDITDQVPVPNRS